MAIHNEHQDKGIGQALITDLSELKSRGVGIVLTYGDPRFYSKVGFRSLSPETIQPPFELSQPEGWLGQSLSGDAIAMLSGQCACVEALSDPKYW
ncbi:MAG: hypothetical protein F6K00_13410 [Leptolyngbya sp. SIOISBB]|nr:hypothetical protein [Leptolyngbya sp. SIOISBB]